MEEDERIAETENLTRISLFQPMEEDGEEQKTTPCVSYLEDPSPYEDIITLINML